jgi:hypothetical protein
MNSNNKMSEAGEQFQSIYKEHHDPVSREKKKILENRRKRAEIIKEDNGL